MGGLYSLEIIEESSVISMFSKGDEGISPGSVVKVGEGKISVAVSFRVGVIRRVLIGVDVFIVDGWKGLI